MPPNSGTIHLSHAYPVDLSGLCCWPDFIVKPENSRMELRNEWLDLLRRHSAEHCATSLTGKALHVAKGLGKQGVVFFIRADGPWDVVPEK